MKKVFIAIFMFLPLMMSAQNVLTPQQQLEQAQKQLEEAKKAVEAAKIQKQIADAQAEAERLKNEAAKLQQEAEQIQKDAQNKSSESQPSANKEITTLPAKDPQPVVVNPNNHGWSVPTATKTTTNKKVEKMANGVTLKKDPKYLEGALSYDNNGKIEFVLHTDANGKNAKQIYDIVYNYMSGLTQDKNNIASRVALVNQGENIIANTMDEWLIFNASFISLDRTEFKYQLVAKIADNSLELTMNRMYFNYEEGRSTGFKDAAENIINDKNALTKKKNDLARLFGKFRKGVIDRKDQIFNDITTLVKQ